MLRDEPEFFFDSVPPGQTPCLLFGIPSVVRSVFTIHHVIRGDMVLFVVQ